MNRLGRLGHLGGLHVSLFRKSSKRDRPRQLARHPRQLPSKTTNGDENDNNNNTKMTLRITMTIIILLLILSG